MIDRNAEIAGNTVEVLERRKSALLEQIAWHESELALFARDYDRNLASARMRAIFEPETERPERRETSRKTGRRGLRLLFLLGFAISLVLGLGLLVARW